MFRIEFLRNPIVALPYINVLIEAVSFISCLLIWLYGSVEIPLIHTNACLGAVSQRFTVGDIESTANDDRRSDPDFG